jgi:hypothetical protein
MRLGLCVVVVLTLAACHSSQPCATLPEMSPLLAQAMLVRVDVYDAALARCSGNFIAVQGAPLESRTFAAGATVRLDVTPGHRVIGMTTFSDPEGRTPSGSACTEAMLSGGHSACLSFSLTAIDGGACSHSDDTCPAGQYCGSDFSCQSGCKGDGDCTDATQPKCSPTRHQCVACLFSTDCTGGMVCSPAGACTAGCDASTPCTGGKTCCGAVCVDTLSDPLNCNGCNQACTGGDTLCCNGQCANPSNSTLHCGMCGNACSTLNATPACSAGVCGWTCTGNFVHCGTGNTGCETPSDNVSNCGGCGNVCTPTNASANMCMSASVCSYTCTPPFMDCLNVGANTDGCETSTHSITACGGCNNACDTTHSIGADCPAGVCTYTGCMAGYSDCNKAGADTDGCEFMDVTHSTGLTVAGNPVTYQYDCAPLGTPGDPTTYMTNGLGMATAACNAWTAAVGGGTCAPFPCTGNVNCVRADTGSICSIWCYTKMNIAGHVKKAATCSCPSTTDLTWN